MLGFLSDADAINTAITGLLTTAPHPTSWDVVNFLNLYSGADRELAAQLLVQRGVDASAVSNAKTYVGTGLPIKISPFWIFASTISGALCVYHGYKRNQSIGWALGWGLFGTFAPIVAPTIAFAQGFAKAKAA